MKTTVVALALGAVIGSGNEPQSGTVPAVLGPACYAADSYTERQITALRSAFASSDPKVVQWRQTTHLPAVADTAIEVVSDSMKCARALATYNTTMDLGGATASKLYLIRAGAMYVASSPQFSTGEWTSQLVLDSTFIHVASYAR